ncbi:hypothetical protein DSM106972_051720 [Dulcicalothrix desertica PCC 7102]|uniref:Abnormal spindle-like microcephaly-associated protein ASH domain-containing protein n=1 Tax=Dulcicalothrix desertica PCC 7102 TaxID=232991 RepID=A0A3S1CAX0_9CYAN|nr:choice-of-anchor D domain-containing protein [Dulcicalothrix desertica]RUT03533.1 hypothetical protein DSM106972_051720 [Dulcicalothrix desertica PCC 7102]TWH50544.1 ASPM-SPD-2-Hydin domain-containing protein [Dulcicalothrix desertica PCC 7102]
MTQQHTEELAKQGDVNAIEALINELIEPNGIKAKVGVKDSCLYVACLGAEIPERQALVKCIGKRILKLGIKSLQSAKIYAAQWGQNKTVWQQEIPLNPLRLDLNNYASAKAPVNPQPAKQLSIGRHKVQTSSKGIIVSKAQQKEIEYHSQCLVMLPRPLPNLIGRLSQIKGALALLDTNQSIEFYGSEGLGKSALLRHILYFIHKNSIFTDGAVWFGNVYYSQVDLLQHLFELFHESDTTYKPTNLETRRFLHNKKLVIFLDDVKLTSEDIQQLELILPDSRFIVASSSQKLSSNSSIQLSGLSKRDSIAFITQKLHQSISAEELVTVEALANLLSGHPYMMQLAVNCINKNVCTLSELVLKLQPPESSQKLIKQILKVLPTEHQNILATLVTVDGIGLSRVQIEALSEANDTSEILASLLDWNLIDTEFNLYSLNKTLVLALKQELVLNSFYERVLSNFITWAEKYPEFLTLGTPNALIPILTWAIETERYSNILRLVKAAEVSLFLSKRWGLWKQVLKYGLQASIALNDKQNEAWMLHQLGSIALCLDDTSVEAHKYLTSALKIRESLNLADAVAATSQNLKLVKISSPEPDEITQYRINRTQTNTKLQFLAIALIPLLCSVFAGLLAWYVVSHLITSPAPSGALSQPKELTNVSTFNVNTSNLNFGKQRVNTESKSETVTITNNSSVSMRIAEIETIGKQGDFDITNSTCATAIPPKQRCNISIVFAPIETGEHRASLQLTDSNGKTLQQIIMKGMAISAIQPTYDIPVAPSPIIQTPLPLPKPKLISPQTPKIINNQHGMDTPYTAPTPIQTPQQPIEPPQAIQTEQHTDTVTESPEVFPNIETTPEPTETPIQAN